MRQTITATPETRASVLARLGNYLDSVEAGLVPCDARGYQLISSKAVGLLALTSACPVAQEAVDGSPALRDLRSNQGIARAISIGLLDLPEEVARALSSPAQGRPGE
jgi:hypothetical protein